LEKKTQLVDGEEKENITYYFIDKENFVAIVVEQTIVAGPMAGKVSQTVMSDYQEVEGLYFPFSINQQVDGVGGSEIVISAIELNPAVEETVFMFPAE